MNIWVQQMSTRERFSICSMGATKGIVKQGFVLLSRADIAQSDENLVSHKRNRKLHSRQPCHVFVPLDPSGEASHFCCRCPCGARIRTLETAALPRIELLDQPASWDWDAFVAFR